MRALLIEDQPIYGGVIVEILRSRFNITEHCFAESVDSAVQCLDDCGPDLVLADFSTGDVSDSLGFETIVSSARAAPVIALDRRLNPAHLRRARAAGAKAYIAKTATRELVDAAIGVVVAGGEYFPQLGDDASRPRPGSADWVRRLTSRQSDVLRLVVEGKTNREIASLLDLSVPTIKLHVHRILQVAGARNRTEAALWSRGK